MSAEVEVYLPSLRGAAVTVGKRTHLLLQSKRPPAWSDVLKPEDKAPTLGSGLLGLFEYTERLKSER